MAPTDINMPAGQEVGLAMLSPYSTRPREPAVHSHSMLYTACHSGMLIYSQHAIRILYTFKCTNDNDM